MEKYGFKEGLTHKKLLSNGIGIIENLKLKLEENYRYEVVSYLYAITTLRSRWWTYESNSHLLFYDFVCKVMIM
ncbi:MAG: hypothetical protein WAM14_12855 [Candidatus Nitrosopolaris sp.]